MDFKETNWAEKNSNENKINFDSKNENYQTNNTENQNLSIDKKEKSTKKDNNKIQLSEDEKNSFEINIIKITKTIQFLENQNNKEVKTYIDFLKDIEKDINSILNVKLSKKEKELLIKYVK